MTRQELLAKIPLFESLTDDDLNAGFSPAAPVSS